MHRDITLYLRSLGGHLRLETAARRGVLRELSTHLEDRAQDLIAQGMPRDQAIAEATRAFGNPRSIATEIYAAHSKGTWLEVSLSALPHLFVAILFGLHLWLQLTWVVPLLLVMAGVSIVGWLRGRPVWVYSWIGYISFPLLLLGLLSLTTLAEGTWHVLTRGYVITSPIAWALGAVFGLLAVSLCIYLLIWVSKRDWLHSSLLILPFPVLALSLLGFERGSTAHFRDADINTALMLLTVAAAVSVFIRLGGRSFKIGVLVMMLPISFLLIANALEANLKLLLALFLSLPALLLLLSPLLLSLGSSDEAATPQDSPTEQ